MESVANFKRKNEGGWIIKVIFESRSQSKENDILEKRVLIFWSALKLMVFEQSFNIQKKNNYLCKSNKLTFKSQEKWAYNMCSVICRYLYVLKSVSSSYNNTTKTALSFSQRFIFLVKSSSLLQTDYCIRFSCQIFFQILICNFLSWQNFF